MELIILSGRSGSGKSTALHQLEDDGFYAIDNLPASLLPSLIAQLSASTLELHRNIAVCIDARNTEEDLSHFKDICAQVREHAHLRVIYLDANNATLIRRFSETRRRHPLSNDQRSLADALSLESHLLAAVMAEASLTIDSSDASVHDLRNLVRKRVLGTHSGRLSIQLQSFGFKRGVPSDADLLFDLRMLPNPHWQAELRSSTGRDLAVQKFLNGKQDVEEMFTDISQYLERWLPRIEESNRSYFTIAIGCTGGQHRSVYMVERLAKHLQSQYPSLQIRHREITN